MSLPPRELAKAESDFLEAQAEVLMRRARELRELTQTSSTKTVEEQLEELAWKTARSGRCDYTKNAPVELVQAVRASKNGIRGERHHFTASTTEPTLFRFERRKEENKLA